MKSNFCISHVYELVLTSSTTFVKNIFLETKPNKKLSGEFDFEDITPYDVGIHACCSPFIMNKFSWEPVNLVLPIKIWQVLSTEWVENKSYSYKLLNMYIKLIHTNTPRQYHHFMSQNNTPHHKFNKILNFIIKNLTTKIWGITKD